MEHIINIKIILLQFVIIVYLQRNLRTFLMLHIIIFMKIRRLCKSTQVHGGRQLQHRCIDEEARYRSVDGHFTLLEEELLLNIWIQAQMKWES